MRRNHPVQTGNGHELLKRQMKAEKSRETTNACPWTRLQNTRRLSPGLLYIFIILFILYSCTRLLHIKTTACYTQAVSSEYFSAPL